MEVEHVAYFDEGGDHGPATIDPSFPAFVEHSVATVIAAAIRKDLQKARARLPDDPYAVALVFCLESLFGLMLDRKAQAGTIYCVFEQRGPVEDRQLAETFRATCDSGNMWKRKLPFELVFASKQQNMRGCRSPILPPIRLRGTRSTPMRQILPTPSLRVASERRSRAKPTVGGSRFFP